MAELENRDSAFSFKATLSGGMMEHIRIIR